MSGIPMWFCNAECTKVISSGVTFHLVEYLGITFRVSGDKMRFKAEDIFRAFNTTIESKKGKLYHSSLWSSFTRIKAGKLIMREFGDDVEEVTKSGTYSGHYMPWFLFSSMLHYAADPINAIRFEQGKHIDLKAPNKGYLYVVQPIDGPRGSGMTSCVGSDVYKYGRTWDMEQRMNMYGNGTKIYAVVEVDDIVSCEAILMQVVKEKSINQAAAYKNEYYRMESYEDAVCAFIDAVDVMEKMAHVCGEIDIRADYDEEEDEE